MARRRITPHFHLSRTQKVTKGNKFAAKTASSCLLEFFPQIGRNAFIYRGSRAISPSDWMANLTGYAPGWEQFQRPQRALPGREPAFWSGLDASLTMATRTGQPTPCRKAGHHPRDGRACLAAPIGTICERFFRWLCGNELQDCNGLNLGSLIREPVPTEWITQFEYAIDMRSSQRISVSLKVSLQGFDEWPPIRGGIA